MTSAESGPRPLSVGSIVVRDSWFWTEAVRDPSLLLLFLFRFIESSNSPASRLRRGGVSDRNFCDDRRSCHRGRNLKFATQLAHTFFHASQPDTQYTGTPAISKHLWRNPDTVIDDLQARHALADRQSNLCRPACRMTMNIGQTFLEDSKHCQFQVRRQTAEIGRDFEVRRGLAALRKSFQVPGNGRLQTQLIQHRGVHQMRNGACFLDRAL